MNFKNITIESSTFLSYSSTIIRLEEYRLCASCQKSVQKVNSFCKICDRKIIFNYPYIHWELKEKLFEFLNDINNKYMTIPHFNDFSDYYVGIQSWKSILLLDLLHCHNTFNNLRPPPKILQYCDIEFNLNLIQLFCYNYLLHNGYQKMIPLDKNNILKYDKS